MSLEIGDKITGKVAKIIIGRDGKTYVYIEFDNYYGVTLKRREA